MKMPNFSTIIQLITASSLFFLAEGLGHQQVTCGSVVKLLNTDYKVRLHSHDVKYGSGSGQQSVTGTEIQEDVNSYWHIKGATGKYCNRGDPIKCGDIIRLEHLSTNKNLHSHHFPSPLSQHQEISAYGDQSGEGDTGDHWTVFCDGEYWMRDNNIMFRHVDTDMFLAVTGRTYGRPINGQLEVVGVSSPSNSQWKAMEGLFIHPSEMLAKSHTHPHTEL